MESSPRLPSAGRRVWWLAPALLALLLVCLAPPPGLAEDEKKDDPGNVAKEEEPGDAAKKEDGAAPPAREKRASLLPLAQADPKAFKTLVEAARVYFDLDEELWTGRKKLLALLEEMAAKGQHPLKDLEFLRWLVYQSRSFQPDMTDRKWQRARGITEAKSLSGTLYWIKSEDLTITFSVPKKYPKLKKLRTEYPRRDPYPLLLTMHEKRDYTGQRFPGEVLVKRRFPKSAWGPLFERWIVLVPEAAAGNFIDRNTGLVRREVFKEPYSTFWKHYHIDFERVILDGTEQALAVAGAMPVFFAGVVFRGKWKLETDAQKALVKNFASVPVYVVDNPELAKQIEEAGHPNVTAGISGPILLKWMEAQRRTLPTKFDWSAQLHDQVLAQWVNLDSPKWEDAERTLEVEVVDTKEHPNTVRIEARGFHDLSLFLNDEIVDLDRPVRVVINQNLEYDQLIEPANERMKKLGRDLDLLFNREPIRIRESMFFGWLKSARVVRLLVRPPPKKEEPVKPKEPTKDEPKATPDQEDMAQRLWERSLIFEKKGNIEKAISNLEKIIELPANKRTDEARKKLAELKKQLEESG